MRLKYEWSTWSRRATSFDRAGCQAARVALRCGDELGGAARRVPAERLAGAACRGLRDRATGCSTPWEARVTPVVSGASGRGLGGTCARQRRTRRRSPRYHQPAPAPATQLTMRRSAATIANPDPHDVSVGACTALGATAAIAAAMLTCVLIAPRSFLAWDFVAPTVDSNLCTQIKWWTDRVNCGYAPQPDTLWR